MTIGGLKTKSNRLERFQMRKLYGLKFILLDAIILFVLLSGCNSYDTNTSSLKTDEIAQKSVFKRLINL